MEATAQLLENSDPTMIGPQSTDGKNPAIDAAVSKLDAAIVRMLNDDESFKTFLQYKGAMHNYSWLNLMLITADYHERGLDGPMLCMGFKAWQKQGRQVRKGSKAITLFKPVLQYWRSYEGVTPGTSGAKFDAKTKTFYLLRSRAVGFELINKTFHVQDTDGPDFDAPVPIKLEDNSELASETYDKLADAARALGITSITQEPSNHGENGYYTPSEKSIHITTGLSFAQQAKTLAHEIAHHVCHDLGLDHHEVYRATRGSAEAVVEGAAFIVLSSFGIDTAQYSVPYITNWASDLNLIRRLMRDMDKVAKRIIEKLPQGAKDVEPQTQTS